MDTRTQRTNRRRTPTWIERRSRLQVMLLACLATVLAGPAGAATDDVVIPKTPLQSGTPYPAPNILFILDDSGSMEYSYMDDEEMPRVSEKSYCYSSDCGLFDERESYVHNTIYYDPHTDYQPWVKADGSRFSGGTTMDNVYGHDSLLSSQDDISDEQFTYYVPKSGITDYSDITQYFRYQIREVSHDGVNGQRVVRSEFSNTSGTTTEIDRRTNLSRGSTGGLTFGPYSVPAGADSLRVEISGGSGNADLYVENGQAPDRNNDECERTGSGNGHVCVITDHLDEPFFVTVYAPETRILWWTIPGEFSGVTLTVSAIKSASGVAGAGCTSNASGYGWRNCTFATPNIGNPGSTADDRTESEELGNFATWYSYHRTRMKVAKAGAGEAFNQLGNNYRVGYDSIWNRNFYPIPTNGDLFNKPCDPTKVADCDTTVGGNREEWYEHLYDANGSGATPLHSALRRAGNYYASADPWKSEGDSVVSCRLSFAILTTDGYWNSLNSADRAVPNVDNQYGPYIYKPVDPNKPDVEPESKRYEPERPYRDSHTGTLADVAMYYWSRDLQPDLPNDVPTSGADDAFWQHMVTFGVSIGLQGTIRNPTTRLDDLKSGALDWPDPMDREDNRRIDDLFHATVNGRGQFVAATNPQQFVRGLLDALTAIAQRPGSASNVTANSTSFNTDTRVYQARYTAGLWTGELASYVATSAGVEDTPDWLASQGIVYKDRKVLTWNGTGGATFPTDAQKTALDRSDRAFSAVAGADNAAYIKGDQAKELAVKGGTLRNRGTLLGDIVNSSPIYVKDSETIFVGANDGMLHAFD